MIKEHLVIWFALTIISMVLLAIIGMLVFVITSNWKHRKNMERLTMYQINVTSTIDSSIPEILSMVIRECFEDYQIKTLLPLEEGFINSTREAEIRRGLVEIVTSRLSSATIDKLSLYYNIKNIADIIADKVYITVLHYVIEHNKSVTSGQ